MDRHEEIKKLCTSILDYYYIVGDTEFTLPTGQRIDVVGYYRNKKSPDIGIEVEITSEFQKDAQKLANTPTFSWRFVVTEDSRTLSLVPIEPNGKLIEIVDPPDKSSTFEQIIRNIVNESKKPWYDHFVRESVLTLESKKDPLLEFSKEISSQGLNSEAAKDVIFKASLGGYHIGSYKWIERVGTEFSPISEFPKKELLYLRARGFIVEDRIGENYVSGKQSVYYITDRAAQLAERVKGERVGKKLSDLQSVFSRYGDNSVIISLLGENGEFKDRNLEKQPLENYSPIIPALLSFPKNTMEEFNLDLRIMYMIHLVADSPLFKPHLRAIYESLTEVFLGNKEEDLASKGYSWGKKYSTPLVQILRKTNIDQWKELLDKEKLKEYVKWLILRSHNPRVPSTLIDPFQVIGILQEELVEMISELSKRGITSSLVNDGVETIAIFEPKLFAEFCEDKMSDILRDLLRSGLTQG